MEKYNKL